MYVRENKSRKMGRKKGFPVQLQKLHWFMVQHAYDYAVQHGLNTAEMDEAAEQIPDCRPSPESVKAVIGATTDRGWDFHSVQGGKTVRFRGTQVDGAIQLLRLGGFLAVSGQAGSTLLRRANDLVEVDTLERITDAGRG